MKCPCCGAELKLEETSPTVWGQNTKHLVKNCPKCSKECEEKTKN
jgi:endogenous inhibitor of DNA gyrase (YacG/DUF329 family)